MKLEGSDPANKVLCTTTGRNEDIRRGAPNLRWCYKLEKGFAKVSCRNWRINEQ
jgi:hypothetical protein